MPPALNRAKAIWAPSGETAGSESATSWLGWNGVSARKCVPSSRTE
jgi:hypothetical protein